jgi:hypothetical protein
MAKLDAGKVSVLAVFSTILLIFSFLLVKSLTAPKNVGATYYDQTCNGDCPEVTFSSSHYIYTDKVIDEEGHYVYADKIVDVTGHYGDCPNGYSVYSNDSTKCRKNSNPHTIIDRPYINATYKCPNGYQSSGNTCRKWVDPTYKCPSGYESSLGYDNCRKTETFSKTFKYNEGEGNQCDRPSAQSLGIPSWAVDDFNKLLQHKNKEEIACPTHSPTPTPTYNPCDSKDNHEDHDDHDNHDNNHDHDNNGCETPTPTPTPTPTATPVPTSGEQNSSNGGPAGAPVCNAEKPGTPTILSAVQNGTSVTLTWSSVPNATYYSIVYGNLPGYQYGVANVGNVTTYTIHSLAPGVVYHFAVNAVNDCMPGDPGTFGGGTGGQVLGASTMAGTGSFEENLYLAIMVIGGTITTFGLKNIKKAFKVVK